MLLRKRRIGLGSRLGGLVLLVALLAGPVAGNARAVPRAASATWAGEWVIVGPQAAGLQRLPAAAADAGEALYQSAARDMGHEFMAVGAVWRAQVPEGAGLTLAVRWSDDGASWEDWQALSIEAGGRDRAAGDSHSDLLIGTGRYLQARVDLRQGTAASAPSLSSLKLVAIDASQGPATGMMASATGATASPSIISRAAWGANETWLNWPPEYAPVSKFVIHHTVTSNSEADPAATVRAIYYYHAVTLDWGDVGYNYMIDRYGRIYEGRAGGDGVIAGHARPYNTGTVGVAILGDFTATDVPAAAVDSLVELLAWKCSLHFVHPLESGWLRDAVFPNIMGHRDCNPTECPGNRAYALLPQIRSRTFERMQAIPPHLQVLQPVASSVLSGVQHLTWRASAGGTEMSVALDGGAQQALVPGAAYWPWNTTTLSDGLHHLQLTAHTSLGQTTSVDLPVLVDNTAPSGSLSAPGYTNGAGVTLALSCADCSAYQLGAGWRWEGESLYHAAGSGRATADPVAANGQAWLGRSGDAAGPWYGPYYCGLPSPGDYEAVFWLRSARNDTTATLARIDVADQEGRRLLAAERPLAASDFSRTDRYQAFRLPFRYPDPGSSCRPGAEDGLELRTWFSAAADLWLDRVEVLTAPRPLVGKVWFPLPAAEGRYPLAVCYRDPAGNASPFYEQTVTVDHTPPAWGDPTSTGLVVHDGLAGLDVAGAAYSLSDGGSTWSAWVDAPLTIGADGSGVLAAQPGWLGRLVRGRVCDRAGNESVSEVFAWSVGGVGPTPTPGPPPDYRYWIQAPLVTR